jgi:enterochelin esterase-like enzyme
MMRVIAMAVGFAVLAVTGLAQQPPAGAPEAQEARGGRPAPPPSSAEVSPDGEVTFRLSAPNATEVLVNGNWEGGRGMAMTKDSSGVWSATTRPLGPEIWNYTYSVNGVTTLDPGNSHVVRDGRRHLNAVLVPGTESALYRTGKTPHGTVAAVWYPSAELQSGRRMLIYTPPGYEESNTRYPVVYLFHGGGGDEEAWISMGSANVILDNLIAQGRAAPMIVVMPNANWTQSAALEGGVARPAPGARGPRLQSYDRAEREIVDNIVPFVEKNYRTLGGRDNRAIAGLSMGGGISINVGLKRLDVFASVAQFSSGMFGGVSGYAPFDVEKISPGFYEDPAATNRKLKVFFFSCGTEDPRMEFQSKAAEEMGDHKIALVFKDYTGGHEWKVWRRSLADLVGLLFR